MFVENSDDVPVTLDLIEEGKNLAGYYKVPGEKDNCPVIIHRNEMTLVGFSSVCPHKQCTVGITESALRCPCHGSKFDLVTGHVTLGPATSDLELLSLEVEVDLVKVNIESGDK